MRKSEQDILNAAIKEAIQANKKIIVLKCVIFALSIAIIILAAVIGIIL